MIITAYRPSERSLYDKPSVAVNDGRRNGPYYRSEEATAFLCELSRYCEMFGRAATIRDYADECKALGSCPTAMLRTARSMFPTPGGIKKARYGSLTIDGSGKVYPSDGPACEHCGGPLACGTCSRCGWEEIQ